mmetsp:Transcript_22481/g.55620  ORF Transcript_22481/g.55620 Transcript_22481/m.55620 type:complete len:142 (+) Transcript_22481:1756-2181(+)
MVNVASRHESTGMAGKIHCSCFLFGLLKHFSKSDTYEFKSRGLVDMKGKGEHYTYWLERATENNPWANEKALEELSGKVKEMIAFWKRLGGTQVGAWFDPIGSSEQDCRCDYFLLEILYSQGGGENEDRRRPASSVCRSDC